MAQEAKVTSLMSKDLEENPRQGGSDDHSGVSARAARTLYTVTMHMRLFTCWRAPIVMQVKGGKEVTLTPGQTFYEGPDDVHVVGRNASSTKPAKFLVFLVKNKGAPVLVPVK